MVRPGVLLLVLALCAACAAPAVTLREVQLHLDGTDRTVQTQAPSVRALFDELEIALDPLDQVEPPLWTPITAGLRIRVVRGYQDIQYETIPHEERIIRDEFLSPAESQTLREGADGQAELRYLLLYDGAALLERRLLERRVLTEPIIAIFLEGSRGLLPKVEVQGTVAYLVNGEPWVLRRDTAQKRPLVRGAQADGLVFDLSPDGRRLLYSVTSATKGQRNALYLIETDVLNTRPQALGIANVLWAAWAPDGQRFAYSTLTPMAGVPGWRATNDLHVIAWPGGASLFETPPTAAFVYAWYGERWAWRPDGKALAFARPDSVGVLDLSTGQRAPLTAFAPGAANEENVMLPSLAWLPNGAQLAYTQPAATGTALWLLTPSTSAAQPLAEGAGGFTLAPSGHQLVLTQSAAEGALAIVTLPAQTLRPLRGDALASLPPQLAWGPVEAQFIFVHEGDLYRYDLNDNQVVPLTATGLAAHPVWR